MKQTSTSSNRSIISRKRSSSRVRTSSATDSNQSISTFESLTPNIQLKANPDASPVFRARRFSDDLILPCSTSSEIAETSLFSPGSVRARTISSIQQDKDLSPLTRKLTSVSRPPPAVSFNVHSSSLSPSKSLGVRLNSGKPLNTSDFIYSNHEKSSPINHLVNPHIDMSHIQQEHKQLSNDTTRNKLLQSVYVNNTDTHNSSLTQSLINGTNFHTNAAESSSDCILS